MHLRRGDIVMVTRGRERGKSGRVMRVFPQAGRVLVEKVNLVKRHSRPTQQLPQGGIVQKEATLSAANLRVVCPKCKKPTRPIRREMAGGKRARACRTCGEILDKV